ncbi:MAG TPA: LapA family protein [Bacteroidales bacterium]|nr:LapA family protein [Bacteroidales bacterium]
MEKPTTKQSSRFYALMAIVLILTVIFIIQNWQPISINLLGFMIQGRLFMVLIAFFGLGFLSGWLGCHVRKERKRLENTKPHQQGG